MLRRIFRDFTPLPFIVTLLFTYNKKQDRLFGNGDDSMKKRQGIYLLGILLFFILFVQAFLRSAGIYPLTMPASASIPAEDSVRDAAKASKTKPASESEAGDSGQTVTEASGRKTQPSKSGMKYVQTEDNEGKYAILYQSGGADQKIPLEEFLVGALAASIDMSYEPETLKAQAVLLRGNCLRKMTASGNGAKAGEASGWQAAYEDLETDYYTLEQLSLIWGDRFSEYYDKAKAAVAQTGGIYARSGGEILNGNFHAMSGGRTRSGKEVFGEESYDYLQSVPCDKNLENENFIQVKKFKSESEGELVILERDSAGYVLKASWNGKELGGEQVRQALGLASANFEVTKDENYTITTKGIGHGFGFDQSYANYLASESGLEYMGLISYFFKDISFTSDSL